MTQARLTETKTKSFRLQSSAEGNFLAGSVLGNCISVGGMTPQAISHWDKVFTLEECVVLGVPYLSVDDTVVTKQPSF